MASHLLSRQINIETTRRRSLVRKVLLESLERRELMAADLLGFNEDSYVSSLTRSVLSEAELTFSSLNPNLGGYDITAMLDATLGSGEGDLTSRPWFGLIEQSYDNWSQQNGLAFSITSGLQAEGEGGLVGEGEAGGPRVLSIAPNSGNIFSFNDVNTLTEAPTELVFRFDGSSGIDANTIARGIKLIRANRDGDFANGNEQVITPGYLSFGENNRIIVMRFATTLPDDLYRVMVIGTDNVAANETAIKNTAGRTLDVRSVDSTPLDLTRDSVDFKVELGAQVVAVVPQPVDRVASNTVNLVQSGGSFTLRVQQGDTTDNAAGNSVSLRLVQSGSTTTAAYDKATNRITVSLAAGATVSDVASAINTGLVGNFSATAVVGGGNAVNTLDLGIRTVTLTNWALDPKRDQIRVYFNEDDLFGAAVKTGDFAPNPTVVDPAFYQLILTKDTVQPGDDVVFGAASISSISYDPRLNLATITYNQPIDQLAGGVGTFRLRIGGKDTVANVSDPKTITPVTFPPGIDQPGDFTGAPAGFFTPVAFTSSTSIAINENIITTSTAVLPLDYAGSNFEPGHRDNQDETHLNAGGDTSPQISTQFYNFALNRPYGLDAANRPVSTTITPDQISRIREIFEFYSMVMGIDFVESESAGMTVVVGDMFPNGVQSGPGGVIGVAGGGLAIMDSAEVWDNSFGGQSGIPGSQNFFLVTMHEIGHLLGYGHATELPVLTVMAGAALPFTEWAFPGDADITHGQFMYRPDNRDVDSYKFVVPAGKSGTFTAETFAERLPNSSNLDTYLTLFKETPNGFEVVAINNDSFSSDSFLSVKLTEGNYFISVTGKGNENFNPLIANTGDGAISQGAYQLKMDFQEDAAAASIVDPAGSALDGDGDGLAGGNFNFWFRTAAPVDVAVPGAPKTIYVEKGFAGASTGSAAAPMNSLDLNNPVKWPVGFVQPGDIIRVVGSLGSDRLLGTSLDNPAYEIGRGGVGNAILSDGINLEVPQGVTMMIDAGAIFKLGNTRITAGSLDAGIDKSFSALQVLGTPRQSANFTSYNDQGQGTDTNPLVTSPQAGDWGGIDLHNNIDRQEGRGDYERKGIFLNYVAHADLRYGGGQITVASPSPTINPINLNEARPTLLYNTIRFSADAAISADPNSFEETRFTEDRYQLAQIFRPDYDRVGPDLRGNIVTNNTVNGLFVRTSTFAGGPLTMLETAARWDDTEITHVLGENLIISGTPGGSFLETTAPDVSLVQTNDATGGSLAVGQSVLYKVTFIDRFGGQSIPSVATPSKLLATTAVQLANLPAATGDFVGRRLWRSTDAGVTYRLVAELDGDTTSYKDLGGDLAATLVNPNATSLQRARPDSRLQIDPGVVVKLTGSRIEVGISAQLIAEGSADRKVIFTSRSDDRYGAGGTFDTNSNLLATNPGAGDWGGLVARHLSSISIDQALITYGGGVTSVSGGFAGFNAVEIHQADGRVTNSVLENNASGLGGNSGANRDGRGPHDASVIFVLGSQPVIAENIIRGNSVSNTSAISVNANALNTKNIQDRGRQTGTVDRVAAGLGNSGPLVDGNLLANNGLNGMRVRGQILTTATVWDDTDTVHILQSEVVVPDLHTNGGMRLQSKADESLVVKLGPGAGITATGAPLDIVDRIGGSLQILGAPGFPVVLTSLTDDSVGAGFDPSGRPLVDTNNNGPSAGSAGSWRSIRLDPYANDRNLETTFEYEPDQIQDTGNNDNASTAQSMGAMAAKTNGGDENLRLGFTLHGTIAAPQDLDVYSFIGTAGTPVWIDIDQTNGSLDTVVELIDSNGAIIAQSNNSLQESVNPAALFVNTARIAQERVQPLDQDPFAPRNSFQTAIARDLYSVNPLDAGFRVVLPGTVGGTNTYYVRVRSSNLKPNDPATKLQDVTKERDGLTTGAYRLQVRMQQNDETAGSAVRFADIRFATNGIEANGMPAHSPLLGQVGEQGAGGGTDALDSPTNLVTGGQIANIPGLGNIVNSDRGSVSLAGSIGAATDVDIYSFSINRASTQGGPNTHISTVLDIDYADGLGRPDTTLWVYRVVNNSPVLVLVGTDSNIADDRSAPAQGADLDALSRGSVGARDPFIGAAELPAGNYFVAVSNNSRMAAAMQQYQTATPANALIRLEPVNSVNRLFIDRIGGTSPDTTAAAPVLFTTAAVGGGIAAANTVPWTLADLTAYVVRNNGNGSQLVFGNVQTGVQEAEISNFVRVNDAAMSPDGRLVGYEIPVTVAATDANSGNLHLINSIGAPGGAGTPTNTSAVQGNSGIQTFTTQITALGTPDTYAIQQRDQNGLIGGNTPQGDGIQFNDITFFTQADDSTNLLMFGVGSRGNNQTSFAMPLLDANNAVVGITPNPNARINFNTTNIVYKLDPNTGAAINPDGVADRTGNGLVNGAGTQKVEFGRFLSGTAANNYTDGIVTGLAEIGGTLYAVSNRGELFSAPLGAGGTAFAPNTTVNTATVIYSGRTTNIIVTDTTGTPIVFTGLTAGPRNLEGGRFANMLFGTTADGTIWAFDTAGVKQPIFPGFQASIRSTSNPLNSTGTVSGIDFSPLDVNLWHQTNTRAADAGHGRTVPFDSSQAANLDGGNSLYFGFEDGGRGQTNRQQGSWQGVYNVAAYAGSYNLPGGARGAIVSNAMDLRGYSADDLPMLYFNYFLATENSNSTLDDGDVRMNDAFRVYGAGEDGNWILLTTNNSALSGGNRNTAADEFDTFINQNTDPYDNPLFTQETFDNTGTWRQARTSLSAFAGQQNVRLRFEFSTGASFRTGDPLLGGVELTAVAGAKLNDGEFFQVTPQDGVSALGVRIFELDTGLVLDLPGGASITSGVSQMIIGGTTVTFTTSAPPGANEIQYLSTDTPAQIASKVRAALPAILGIAAGNITVHSLRPNVLNISGLVASNAPRIGDVEPNNTLATAQNVDGAVWSLALDVKVDSSTTRPHLSILGTGNSTFDYYSFTANAGAVGVFDIDSTNFDTELFLYDSAGNLLAQNDDANLDPGSTSTFESFLSHTFAAAGTYIIGVGRFDSVGLAGGIAGSTPLAGDIYQLNISVDGKTTLAPNYDVVGLSKNVIAGFPGVTVGGSTGIVSVAINQSMTETQVRDTIRAQLAATFNSTLVPATANASALQAWPVHNSTLRLFKYSVVNFSELGLTTRRSGDLFGVQTTPHSGSNRLDERAQNNAFEGVYIDDIIVGFAERGEMVFNSTAADAITNFVANTHYSGLASTFGIPQVEQGAYQLTTRTAAEYGLQDGTNILLRPSPFARSFDTNARLAEQVGILVNSAAAGQFADGITFTVSDGFNQATFEFVVTVGTGDAASGVTPGNIAVRIAANATPTQIATAIRDAINSSTAQLILSLTASLQGEMTFGTVFGDVADSGSALVLLHGAAATNRTGSLIFSSTPLLTAVRSGTESSFGEDLGDAERQREQGQILLVGNSITNSSQFGINNDAGARIQQAAGSRPYPGSPIQLPTQNQFNLAPGVVIMNNILANNASGGLRLSGDGGNTGMAVPSLITRVINNTIFGGTDGILVDEGASPTILNNILANTTNGVRAVGSTVVLGANIFQSNTNHTVGTGGNGSFAEILNPGDPLFASTTNRRFYLAAGSRAIDSSLEALQERPELTQVKNAIGLPLSPMLAPDVDVTGQRRVDDPSVNSPAGLGGNVFKDRGAVDRSDFLGLNAIILQPQDNDSQLDDVDRNTTFIQLTEGELEFFSLLLQDTNGTGPDETTVNAPGAVILTENGRLLVPDVDYVFGYNANSRTIRLTPIAGIWRKDSVYEISLNNRTGIQLKVGSGAAVADGNRYTINYPGGPKVFEFDTGSPAGVSANAVPVRIQSGYTPYQVAAQLVAAINGAGIGVSSYLQGDGTLMVLGATSITATGAALGTPLSVGAIRDLAGNALFPNRATGLTQFTIVMPDVKLDFGDASGANVPTIKQPNSTVVPVVTNGDGARHALLPIDVLPVLSLGSFADADTDGVPSVSASSDDTESLIALETLGTLGGATLSFAGSATLAVNRAAIVDGQTFTITDTAANPLFGVVFEFTTDASVTAGNTAIPVAGGDSSATVANNLATVINSVVLSGRLNDLIAVVDPSSPANVRLIANAGYQINIPVATAAALARLANGNATIVLPNAVSPAMDGNQFSFRDGNGNLVRFELNHVPAASVPVPVPVGIVEVALDLSTATPTTLATSIAAAINNQIAGRKLVMAPVTPNANLIPLVVDDEDGVVFKGMFNARSNPVVATVTSTGAGMLDAWIDWNGDGDFNDGSEQIIVTQPVQAGANTFNVTTPLNATIGFVNARFRLSTLGGALPSGVSIGGEVEDYLIEIVTGTPPVAVSESYSVNEDTMLNANDPRGLLTPGNANDNGVLANDTDADNDPLALPVPYIEPRFVFDENPNTASIDPLVNVSNGTLTLSRDGTFTYLPNLDFNGTDTFVYNVVDQRLKSNVPTTVTITVVPRNDAPLGVNDSISVIEDEVVARAGSVFTANDFAHFGMQPGASFSANASNESGQILTLVDGGASIISEMTTSFGGISGLGVRIAAKPGQGTYGIRVNVLASDLGAGVAPTVSVVNSTITVNLNSNAASVSTVNDFIAAINGNAAAAALVSVTVTLGAGTTQIGNVATAYSPLVVPPSGGTVSVASNQLIYTPPAHYNSNIGGPALLLLTIKDDGSAGDIANLTSTSTLTINIAAVNDRPQYDPWTDPREVATVEVRNDNVGALVTVPNFITGILPGPVEAVDEATGPSLVAAENQSVTFSPAPPLVRALNPELFVVQPAIAVVGNTGTLTFQLAQDVNRVTPFPKILVEVIAQDSGAVGGANNNLNLSIARTFTIVPTEVNDAPEFTIPVSVGSLEDVGVVTVNSFITGIRKGPVTALDEVTQTLSVTIVADPTAFTATGYPTIDLATGQLRYETAPHVNRFTGQNFNVSVTVSDDGGTALGGVDRTTKSFLIDVTELNDAPEYVMPSVTSAFVEDPNAAPNAPTVVPGFVTSIKPGPAAAVDEGPLRENQIVSFVVTALDPSLFDPAFLPTISNTGTLTYRLRPDVNQITPFPRILVEVKAVDTGLNDAGNAVPRNINNAAPRTFTILPDPINDAPEFTLATPPVSREDVGVVTLVDFVTGAAPGPITALDELASQTLTITVVALDPSAFTATGQPQIVLNGGKGVLTYETNRDVNSLTGHDLRVRVTLKDSGGTANVGDVDTTIKTFALSVAAINDAPSFSLPAVPAVTVDEDIELVTGVTPTVLPLATNVVTGPATALDETTILATRQTLAFETISVTNAGLFVVQPRLLPNGNLTFVTNKDQNGQSVVVVRLRDSGLDSTTGNGDINVSAEQTFTINIRAINDAPEFTIQPTANSREDQGLVQVADFLTGILPGPATATDEAGQAVTVTVVAIDPTKFTVQPSIGADGRLVFQTAADVNSQNANLDVRVTLTDDGPSAAPNVNSVETIFSIQAAPINDAPLFTITNRNIVVNEDVGPYQEIMIDGMAVGPVTASDEVNQTLQFAIVSVSAPELFSQQPSIARVGNTTQGQLSFATAQHKNGSALVVVRLEDNGSAVAPNVNASRLQTFTISINPINDAPEFTIPGSYTVDEDQGLVSVNAFATNVRRGPAGAEDENTQVLQFIVSAVDPSVFSVQPRIAVDGTLVFQLADNVNTNNAAIDGKSLQVKVALQDNGPGTLPHLSRSDDKIFTVLVNPLNDSPQSIDFFTTTDEDQSINLLSTNVLVNAVGGPTSDELNQSVFMEQVERVSLRGGTIVPVFDANDRIVSLTYTPPSNAAGADSFVYVLRDNGIPSRSGTATISVTINALNDAPQFTVGANQSSVEDAGDVTINNWATNILAGPIDAVDEHTTQTVTFEVTVDNPALFLIQPTVASDGTLFYQSAADANGSTVIRVVAVDNGSSVLPKNINKSAPQSATITILPLNDAPVFTSGGDISIVEDSGIFQSNWATDIRPAAGLLAQPPRALDEQQQIVDFTVVVDKPDLFSVQPTVSSAGVLSFTPSQNASGNAVLTIRAVDRGPSGGQHVNTSDPVTITVTITGENDPPVAVNDNYTTDENSVLTITAPGLLGNDFDADGTIDLVTVIPATLKSSLGADVTINADGSFTYDPSGVLAIQRMTTNQSMLDTFTYTATDSSNEPSNLAVVNIRVNGINDAPIARNDQFSIGVGQTRLLEILGNDTDVDSVIDGRTIQITQVPIFGTVIVNQTGVVQYSAEAGFRGNDTFAYVVRDALGEVSNEAIVTVIVNNAPVANPDVTFTFKNETIVIPVLINDTDLDGTLDRDSIEIVVFPSPSGTATPQANGTISFTPSTNFAGEVTFSYVVSDDVGTASNVAQVTVRVLNSKWQNPAFNLDVNNDGKISPVDALIIINFLNDPDNERFLPTSGFVPPPFVDVDGNERVSSNDALLVINYLNERSAGGGGEGESTAAGFNYAMMVTPQQMVDTVGAAVVREVERLLAQLRQEALAEATGAVAAPASGRTAGSTQLSDDTDLLAALSAAEEQAKKGKANKNVDDFFAELGPKLA